MMVVMPLTRDHSRPELINGKVGAVKITAFFTKIFAAAVAAIVVSPNSDSPKSRSAKDGAYQGHAADKIENRKPESPVEKKVGNCPEGVANGTPFQILLVTVDLDARVLNQGRSSNVILAVHVPGNGLVIYVRQKAIEPSAVYVIGVTGFFGKLVMNMVGDDVNLLRNQLNDHLTDDKKPKPVGEGESVMGSVAVQINGSMGAQNDHAVNKCNEEKFPGEIVKKEYKEKRRK